MHVLVKRASNLNEGCEMYKKFSIQRMSIKVHQLFHFFSEERHKKLKQ